MDTQPNSSVKIDRLSSLPPELLLTIFDLAYESNQLLLEPLSKCLLPYFRRNLYRQIRISSLPSFVELLRTIKHAPELGELVESLDTSGAFSESQPGTFGEIIKPFPRLNSLKTGYIQPIQHTPTDIVLPSLNYLSYECQTPVISALVFLANLNLSTLEINFHSTDVIPRPLPSPRLTSLKKLSLVRHVDEEDDLEDLVWNSSLINIIDCCPDITSLRLFDPEYPDFRALLANASSFASRITSLELETGRLDDMYPFSCDHLLPRFPNLAYLSLDDGTVGELLPSYLCQLPLLTSLRLGPESHWNLGVTGCSSLLRGPDRLPSLRNLIFQCLEGQIGRRIKAEDRISEYGDLRMKEDGWVKPAFFGRFSREDAQELQTLCKENGVKIDLDLPSVFGLEDDYELERANRSVLRCLQLKSLRPVKNYYDGSPEFSHIPLNNFDPQNLKLVKTELPEKNWFRLSLE